MAIKSNHLFSAKEITAKYKVRYPTINYYTDIGLITIAKREGNKRLYDKKEVHDRLNLISKMVNEGYPLRLIRKKISAKNGGL